MIGADNGGGGGGGGCVVIGGVGGVGGGVGAAALADALRWSFIISFFLVEKKIAIKK